MFPFIGFDVMDSRTPDSDDIAWHGFVYPSASYDAAFGSIEGDVPFGSTMIGCTPPRGANGAHVVARSLDELIGGEPRMIVGTYSYTADGRLGRYRIPGLPPGGYGIWIEPLDGSPVGAIQINTRVQFTRNTDFPEDWYSGNAESATEPAPGDSATAALVTVTAGNGVTGIDIIIEEFVPGWCMNVVASTQRGRDNRSRVATGLILILPLAFLHLMKRIAANKSK
jgi:hypothetical protein